MADFTDNDKELVRKVLLRDNAAFRELVKHHQQLVFSIVFKILKVGTDREDICQEIFIKVYHYLPNFKFDSKLSTWIARIAYTTSLNHLQKNKKNYFDSIGQTEKIEDNDLSHIEQIQDTGSKNPEQIMFSKDILSKLAEAVDLLPTKLKTIIMLYHQEELSYNEISEITKLPVGTVKSHLFRGRKLLRDRLLSKYRQGDLL